MVANLHLQIRKGSTFSRVLRWESGPVIFRPITGITKAAPAVVTAPAHGIPDGWRVAFVSVQGMRQINAEGDPPRVRDYHRASVVDADTVQFDDVNAAGFAPYRSGGYLRFNTPVPIAGYAARMSIKDRIGGTELLRLDTTNGGIVLDSTNCTITLEIDASVTALLAWRSGVYDLEMESPTGVVTALVSGAVTVAAEITTD